MNADEVALSDVHVDGPNLVLDDIKHGTYQAAVTRFLFQWTVDSCDECLPSLVSTILEPSHSPPRYTGTEPIHLASNGHSLAVSMEASSSEINACNSHLMEHHLDDDGDLIITRPSKPQLEVINIEHTMATRLVDVGLQVWQGCLLLCDYIVHHAADFHESVVLELGGGTGLASVVMATVAKTVICTDTGQDVLAICSKNINNHKTLYPERTEVKVHDLDWREDDLKTEGPFAWTTDDLDVLNRVDIIIAADVVYDLDLTDAFFGSILDLLTQKSVKRIIIALERRLNFTLGNLEVSCAAYEHFRECLELLIKYSAERSINIIFHQEHHIHQHFIYKRTKHLELWIIRVT